jgi:UDP-N-acetylmuramoyl-tripeptide--D-alanyl-D-alanine ligase
MTHLFTADELSHATGGAMLAPIHADGVSIDTRTLQPGDLFVALKTASGDGHAHVAEAMRRGAAGALVHDRAACGDETRLLVVGNTQTALTALGAFARERFEGSVIAVTGSVGKTSTKEMLRAALFACGPTHAAHASYNNHWGVPLTLARAPREAAYCVVEIGMNNPGEIAPLARLAGPDVAVITAVEATHIGHLGSLEAIADEKASIFQGILQGGTAIMPSFSPFTARLAAQVPAHARTMMFGDDTLMALEQREDGSAFSARIGGETVPVALRAAGRHMVMNALAALTACAAAGADLQLCALGLGNFTPVAGRGAKRKLLGGRATLLDESYNASGASMRAALSVLRLIQAERHIAVLGDMLELGTHSEAEHAGLAKDVGECADLLYTCGDWMAYLHRAVPEGKRGAHRADSAALAPVVAAALRPGDAVLVKGSLGSRMRVVVDALEAAG